MRRLHNVPPLAADGRQTIDTMDGGRTVAAWRRLGATALIAFMTAMSVGVPCLAAGDGCDTLVWGGRAQTVTYAVTGAVSPVVRQALDMFTDDISQVTGLSPRAAAAGEATIEITQLDKAAPAVLERLRAQGIAADSLLAFTDSRGTLIDAFSVTATAEKIYAVGNNGRGTAYAILELSRLAGVSPWIWWGDVVPERREELAIPVGFGTLQRASVEYRGIFINDEDWTFRQWSTATYEPGGSFGAIGPATYKRVFQLLLRLRANALWPAMHTGTRAFFTVAGNKAMADSFGIVVGTSHCEPLLRNNVDEWKVAERGDYNYITNGAAVRDYWTERLREVRGSDVMFTLGMRGIHDGPMEGVGSTMDEKTAALQQVIDDQRALLSEYIDSNVTAVEQVFVPYKEVLQIMDNGLDVPDDVTLVWCDDNYGYLTRLPDAEQQRRYSGGVYYHLSYWGRPHDYLWLATTQPGLVYAEMAEAYRHNARKLWIVNVHDVKAAAYPLTLFLDMAWNINCVSASTVRSHLHAFIEDIYGSSAAAVLTPALATYYRLCAIRKPEHLGWTQVELDKSLYPRGRSQVRDTQFSETAFGGELQRYLADYSTVCNAVERAGRMIRPELMDSYFATVKYPVFAAAAMATKMLEAQRARAVYLGQTDTTMLHRRQRAEEHAARSLGAYRYIHTLTDYYNNVTAGGKWHGSMDAMPRDLYVFYPPLLPFEPDSVVTPTADIITAPEYTDMDEVTVRNACDFDKATAGATAIQLLGHSLNAVSLPKGATLTYSFETTAAGDALLYTALIPTQPGDGGDLRYAVAIDGASADTISIKEPFRSDKWKENVLRQQALNVTPVRLTAGSHTLVIEAIDSHVVIDQWMIDFAPRRSFYVFPVEPAL